MAKNRKRTSHPQIEVFRQQNIKLAIARLGLAELESYGHLYDSGAALVEPTLIAFAIRIRRLEKERDAMICG